MLSKVRHWFDKNYDSIELFTILAIAVCGVVWALWPTTVKVNEVQRNVLCINGIQYNKFAKGVTLKFDASGQSAKCENS